MIKAIIIDDEAHARESLTNVIHQYCQEITVIGSGENVADAIALINRFSPDIVFLDIDLPNGNGFTLFEHITSPNFETIFTTAYEEYAIKAFRVAALDYLTKPIDFRQLIEAVERFRTKQKVELKEQRIELLLENLSNKPTEFNKLVLPDYDGYTLIKVSDIIYCKADGSYTEIYLLNGKTITTSKLLKVVEELLPSQTFYRIHKSYVVNMNLIKRYNKSEGHQVLMENNTLLDVSDRNKKEFIERLVQNN
ncbi:MAG: response regulator transcription factor [Crocinitomicaceae bacterium]|nr:response regulator transcription factor [Crocinitomicaceae bacterium]